MIDAVKKVSHTGFEVRMTGRRAGDPADLVADAARLPKLLGWTPEYADLETIVSHAYAWETHLTLLKAAS